MNFASLKFMRTISTLILLASFVGVAFGQAARYTLHLTNHSGFAVYEIYLSSSDHRHGGKELLGNDIPASPGSVNFTDIVAGEYDTRFVDENGDSCMRMKVKFFQDKAINVIGCEFHNR